MDLVYRLGRLDVPGRNSVDSRISPEGTRLLIDPCIPRAWRDFEIEFRYHSSRYKIVVENPRGATRGVTSIEIDGTIVPGGVNEIALANDGMTHKVRVTLG